MQTGGKHVDFLLIGGGLASATAAENLRVEGAEGAILILSAENELPYQRPPLSKRFILTSQAREQLLVLKPDYYREHHIDVMLGTRALSVDPVNQIVQTDQAGDIHYGQLLIATGSRPLRLNIPGASLKGLYYLRTIEQAVEIKHIAEPGKRAVVVGGSFIGMELAATLTAKGVHVTLLARESVLFEKLDSVRLSEYFYKLYLEHGVEVVLGDSPAAFRGEGHVVEVVTHGGRTIPCDFVALGVGVVPDIDFLNGSGIEVDGGVVVNDHLETNYPNVYAAGDVAKFFDPVFQLRRRVEHWDNAVKQGRLAAKNMLGQRVRYDDVSYFFCDVFDISFQFFGSTSDALERTEVGALEERSYALLYLKDDVPRALFSIGRPAKETRAIEALIRYRVNIDRLKERLKDPHFALERIPSQTVLILQGGGALGAFECGVVKAMEEQGVYPDIVAGVSIGGMNGAIIASHPRHATAALEAFWNDLGVVAFDVPDERLRRALSSWQSMMWGSSKFFRPRWFMPMTSFNDLPFFWTSFYDTAPIKALLEQYVDFEKLRISPIRLLVSAVNVETAALEIFDSYVDKLTADHIVASGSIPPGFPWTTIDGKHYWDGGIVSNSPLEQVIERCGATSKRVFVVDLYPNRQALPVDMAEVMMRRDEIVYAERIRRDKSTEVLVNDFRKLVEETLSHVDPQTAIQLKQRPRYIQLMGDVSPMKITRIMREIENGETPSKDYDFSTKSIAGHKEAGYRMTLHTLSK